jgi:hypothetical protein
MRLINSVAGAMLATLGSLPFASAEPVKGVVELFTSQSCSSCPPAEKILGKLVQRGGVVGLAFHVEYWNHLNWKDTLSNKLSTDRQYAYSASFHSSQVYTPQLIVNGRTSVQAGSPQDVFDAIETMSKSGEGLPVSLSATLSKNRIGVTAGKGKGEANLVMVIFETKNTIDVLRGENAGRTIENYNAVTAMQTIGMWKGEAMSIELPRKEYLKEKGYGCAILLQRVTAQDTPGEIIGATLVKDVSS